jgi:hypothetical protein
MPIRLNYLSLIPPNVGFGVVSEVIAGALGVKGFMAPIPGA